jgi:hypothetical protein
MMGMRLGIRKNVITAKKVLGISPYNFAINSFDNFFDFTSSELMALDGSNNLSSIEDIGQNETLENSVGVTQPNFDGSKVNFINDSLEDVGGLMKSLPSDIYISLQFNISSTDQGGLLSEWNGTDDDRSWLIYYRDGEVSFYSADQSGTITTNLLGSVSLNTDYIISVRVSKLGLTAYVKLESASSVIYDASFTILVRNQAFYSPMLNQQNQSALMSFSSKFLAISSGKLDHSLHNLMMPFI